MTTKQDSKNIKIKMEIKNLYQNKILPVVTTASLILMYGTAFAANKPKIKGIPKAANQVTIVQEAPEAPKSNSTLPDVIENYMGVWEENMTNKDVEIEQRKKQLEAQEKERTSYLENTLKEVREVGKLFDRFGNKIAEYMPRENSGQQIPMPSVPRSTSPSALELSVGTDLLLGDNKGIIYNAALYLGNLGLEVGYGNIENTNSQSIPMGKYTYSGNSTTKQSMIDGMVKGNFRICDWLYFNPGLGVGMDFVSKEASEKLLKNGAIMNEKSNSKTDDTKYNVKYELGAGCKIGSFKVKASAGGRGKQTYFGARIGYEL
jgi:hypothetical protein